MTDKSGSILLGLWLENQRVLVVPNPKLQRQHVCHLGFSHPSFRILFQWLAFGFHLLQPHRTLWHWLLGRYSRVLEYQQAVRLKD